MEHGHVMPQIGSVHTHYNHEGVSLHAKGYRLRRCVGHPRADKGGMVFEHLLVVEWVLGRSLVEEEQVHHVNGDGCDNGPGNLVVCPTAAYHKLLHARTRAVAAGYPPFYRTCKFCKRFDDPRDLAGRGTKASGHYHNACARDYQRARALARVAVAS